MVYISFHRSTLNEIIQQTTSGKIITRGTGFGMETVRAKPQL